MVKVRPRGKGWQYDIIFRWPDGEKFRERAQAPVASKSAAQRWAESRERDLLAKGKAAHESKNLFDVPAVPPLADFWPRVVSDHYLANRKKASTLDAAKSIFKNHLGPTLGTKPLHLITSADVSSLKGALASKGAKTVNNVLSVLSRVLRCAVEWDVIKVVPCKFGLLKTQETDRDWYVLPEYRRLVDAATCSRSIHLLVLLAGSAGLRRGEIIALKWTDIDFDRKQIRLKRAIWRKVEDTPKGGRGRDVPLTPELHAALKAHRHLRERVLYSERGEEVSNRTIRNWLMRAQRRANLEATGGIHTLRHTFCSHLAIAGVPVTAIQALAGHADLKTTMRYMHLAPGDRGAAMGALAKYYGTDEARKKAAG